MKKDDKDELEIVYLDEKELLEGLLQITQGNLGAAHSLLDRVFKVTHEMLEPRLQELQSNLDRELRNAADRAADRFKKSMGAYPGAKPEGMDLHHLVSWGHSRAEKALAILLQFGIDPHSAANGAYMPRSVGHTPHPDMPNAYAHNRVHRNIYHDNVFFVLREAATIPGATKADIEEILRDIALRLQAGTFPIHELLVGA
jgi:hypothetical protein